MVLKTLLSTILTATLPVASQSTWITLSPVPVRGTLQEHSTVALSDSLLVVVGGLVEGGNTTGNVLLYDIPAATWTQVAPLPLPLNHPSAMASNEYIYVSGGLGGESGWPPVWETFRYDLGADEWEELGLIPEDSERGSAITAVHGARAYLAGGIPGGAGDSVTTWYLRPRVGRVARGPRGGGAHPGPSRSWRRRRR